MTERPGDIRVRPATKRPGVARERERGRRDCVLARHVPALESRWVGLPGGAAGNESRGGGKILAICRLSRVDCRPPGLAASGTFCRLRDLLGLTSCMACQESCSLELLAGESRTRSAKR